MSPHHGEQKEILEQYDKLRESVPEVVSSYAAFHRAAMAEGALSMKTKELVALAIAITRQCEGCIIAHARGAARRGASTQEIAETIGVCMLMNGGPATAYGPQALAAYEAFTSERASSAMPASTGSPA